MMNYRTNNPKTESTFYRPVDSGGLFTATVSGVEGVNGSSGDDSLVGNSSRNTLNGKGGNDTLTFADATSGGVNVDTFDGGTGTDTFVLSNEALAAHLVDLSNGLLLSGVDIRGILTSIENVRVAGDHSVIGDSGDNVITGTSASGANTFTGGAGMDILNGGGGNDRLVAGAALEQGEEYNGGAGFDTLDLTGLTAGYFVNLATGAISGGTGLGGGGFFTATVSGVEVVQGSSGDDRLVGNSSSNILNGKGGNDTLTFSEASSGGVNVDTFDGGAGTDTFVLSNEALAAHIVDLSTGRLLNGTAYRGSLVSIENVRVAGDHSVIGTSGANVITGTSANGANTFSGGAGNDSLFGGGGVDTLNGDDGDDRLDGGDGGDIVNGGAGNDTLVYDQAVTSAASFDRLRGDAGTDTLLLSNIALGAVTVNLADGRIYDAGATVGTLATIENVTVAGAQTVVGNLGANVIRGLSATASNNFSGGFGADTLDGGGGNDTLKGGDGNDTLLGGAGNDYLLYAESFFSATNVDSFDGGIGSDTFVISSFSLGAATINLLSGKLLDGAALRGTITNVENVQVAGSQNVTGDAGDNVISNTLSGDNIFSGLAGNDTLNGGGGVDRLYGGRGNDTLDGGFGNDRIRGGNGNDTIIGGSGTDNIKGNKGNDIINGNADRDWIFGDQGKDRLNGDSGADFLYGGSGKDILRGGKGADTVDGGIGNDWLIGGGRADKFVFKTGYDMDRIKDYTFGVDTLEFTGFGLSATQILAAGAQAGTDVVFDMGAGDILTLLNVNLVDLTVADILSL
jgi:Ca2+-binding RTX toxin-like protein